MSRDSESWVETELGDKVVKEKIAAVRHRKELQTSYTHLKSDMRITKTLSGLLIGVSVSMSGAKTYKTYQGYTEIRSISEAQREIYVRDGFFEAAVWLLPVLMGVYCWRKATSRFNREMNKLLLEYGDSFD